MGVALATALNEMLVLATDVRPLLRELTGAELSSLELIASNRGFHVVALACVRESTRRERGAVSRAIAECA